MRISENHLKKIIRNIILAEGAVTPEQLGDDYMVVVQDSGIVNRPFKSLGRVDIEQRFSHIDPNTIMRMPSYSLQIRNKIETSKLAEPAYQVMAELEMRKWNGMCNNAWEIYWADVHKDYAGGGFGPLMYDVAMELAGVHGVMCDRNSVSNDAARVWNYYLSRADVFTDDIDIDNCPSDMLSGNDRISIDLGEEHPWHQKVYFSTHYIAGNQKPTLDALNRLGRIEYIGRRYPGEK